MRSRDIESTALYAMHHFALCLLQPFTALLLAAVLRNLVMFRRRHGRAHRLVGAAHLCLLALGAFDVATFTAPLPLRSLAFDVLLACSGTVLTLTAASGFGHRNVRNPASGTLDETATVTHAETLEHAFYQVLNGIQAVYLHALIHVDGRIARAALCLLTTTPWLFRPLVPVHSFRSNYVGKPLTREAVMYRVKKWQYVLYKHALLVGVNVCAALNPELIDPAGKAWRLYWLCLNASYVMEFFLQTLVKKKYMSQSQMLFLNALLMAASSLAALPIVTGVRPLVALTSLALNFGRRRGKEVSNVALLFAVTALSSREL